MQTAAPASAPRPAAAPHACAHCGLPAPPPAEGVLPFCCTGCRLVHDALRQAGMGDTFYRLRGLDRREAVPADPSVSEHTLSELDTDAYLDAHTTPRPDGARSAALFLDGVHCAACVWLVERLPHAVPGVEAARLDLPRARLHLTWRPEAVRLSDVARHLARFGYRAHPVRRDSGSGRTEEERRLLVRVGVCWALAGNVMLLAFAGYAGVDLATEPGLAQAARYLSLALAVPSLLVGGSVFFRRAAASIQLAVRARRLRGLHMDTPIALGLAIGFADSAWATVTGRGEVWFDSITVLIAALLTARWLQLRSRRLAGDAGDRLLALIPSMARRLDPAAPAADPAWVRADELAPGDLVLVPAGEVFPADGVVEAGQSAVNNAVLTGESRPEPLAPGADVAAGATNLSAPVHLRVTAAGEATRVGELLRWVRDAEGRRAPVVLLADRIGGTFVAAVLTLAAATAVLWSLLDPAQAPAHVVALLVITCPCALGMATPLAMAVAAGRAARVGTFIKSDEATQRLPELDTIVLDKTGTLTEGTLALVEHAGDAHAVDLAAALEVHSNHPIAAALLAARRPDPEAAPRWRVEDVEVVHGGGISGRVDGRAVRVGRPGWVWKNVRTADARLGAALDAFAAAGHTPVAVAVDGRVTAVLAFGDRLRPDAAATVVALRASGRALYLLSGDHPDVVARLARTLGLPQEHALGGRDPEAKRAFIEALRAEGRTVGMVGDGVNDAAALGAADVGIAVAGGSTVGLVAADVFLTQPGLAPVRRLLEGTHAVMRVVRRNLVFSLFYNLAGAAAAMAGLVTPLVAAVAMPVSSLVVVLSSIAQRSFVGDEAAAPLPPVADPPARRAA